MIFFLLGIGVVMLAQITGGVPIKMRNWRNLPEIRLAPRNAIQVRIIQKMEKNPSTFAYNADRYQASEAQNFKNPSSAVSMTTALTES